MSKIKVHPKLEEVLNEFKLIGIFESKLKFIVSNDQNFIYEIKDNEGGLHTITIVSDVPMFRNTKIKELLYKTPIYFSHDLEGKKVFEFRLCDYVKQD